MINHDEECNGGDRSLISIATQLLTLYVAYVFVSGWAFLDYYFRSFGLDTRSLDLTFHDTMIRGFTTLFTGNWQLWCAYLGLLVTPLLADYAKPKSRSRRFWHGLVLSVMLVAILLGVYWTSREAGRKHAALNKSDRSRLPTVSFSLDDGRFLHGRLVLLKDGAAYVHGAAPSISSSTPPSEVETLRVFMLDKLKFVEIIEPGEGG